MDFDAWNHWLLLRPLIVFLLAAPLIAAAVLVGWYQARHAEARQETAGKSKTTSADVDQRDVASAVVPEVDRKTRPTTRAADRPDQVIAATDEARAATGVPREWDGGPLRPNWNRQVRLSSGMR